MEPKKLACGMPFGLISYTFVILIILAKTESGSLSHPVP